MTHQNDHPFTSTRDRGSERRTDRVSGRVGTDDSVLVRARIARVRVEYDGCFDFATIRYPVYLTAEGHLFEPKLPMSVRQELRLFFTELLEIRYPGWANAEGAKGEFEWNLEDDT